MDAYFLFIYLLIYLFILLMSDFKNILIHVDRAFDSLSLTLSAFKIVW